MTRKERIERAAAAFITQGRDVDFAIIEAYQFIDAIDALPDAKATRASKALAISPFWNLQEPPTDVSMGINNPLTPAQVRDEMQRRVTLALYRVERAKDDLRDGKTTAFALKWAKYDLALFDSAVKAIDAMPDAEPAQAGRVPDTTTPLRAGDEVKIIGPSWNGLPGMEGVHAHVNEIDSEGEVSVFCDDMEAATFPRASLDGPLNRKPDHIVGSNPKIAAPESGFFIDPSHHRREHRDESGWKMSIQPRQHTLIIIVTPSGEVVKAAWYDQRAGYQIEGFDGHDNNSVMHIVTDNQDQQECIAAFGKQAPAKFQPKKGNQ
jgi:hypothetical protein